MRRWKWVTIGGVAFISGLLFLWEPLYWLGWGILMWRLVRSFMRTKLGRYMWNG